MMNPIKILRLERLKIKSVVFLLKMASYVKIILLGKVLRELSYLFVMGLKVKHLQNYLYFTS